MASILELLNRVKELNVQDVSERSMEEAAPEMTKRQREQMMKGINSKGKKIGRYRSPAYARLKNQMNPVPGLGTPDLRKTGEFHKDIYTEIRGEDVILDSYNEKTEALAKKYGEVIFGLAKDSKSEFVNEDLRPVFMKNVREKLKL